MLIGYARTSQLHQRAGLEGQIEDLKSAGCERLFVEQVSALSQRAELEAALGYCRDGDQPIGLALWARCSPAAAAKLEGGMLEPENRLTLEEWQSGDAVWLVDLIAPFSTAENKQREIMIADLVSKPLKGQEFRFHQTDPKTGERKVQTVGADAGDRLKSVIEEAVRTMEKGGGPH
jgi:hemolysin-activating ACP:hemolysin acyltransferase